MTTNTDPESAVRYLEAQPRRHTSWPASDIQPQRNYSLGHLQDLQTMDRLPDELAPAEELQAEPRRVKTPQDAGEFAGTVVGFTVITLAVIAGVSWLTSCSASAFFTWAGKTLAGWLS